MYKKFFSIIFIFVFFFINVSGVSAVKCADITKEISNYNTIEKKLSNIDCTKDTDAKIVKKCNKLNLKKSSSISKLYKMKQQNNSCTSAKKKVDNIIQKNTANCSKVSDGFLEDFTSKFLTLFYIIGPILVILFGSLDYTKAVVSSDAAALRKTSIRFLKRIAALILLYLTPALVNIVINMNNTDYLLSGEGYSCKADFIVLKKTYTITYVPKESSADTSDISGSSGDSDGSGTSSGSTSGDYLNWTQCNSSWSNLTLGTSSTSVCRAGCLVTSVAIQIANSKTAKGKFDPGVLVKTLKNHGGFSGANFTWTGWQSIAPNFSVYNKSALISGSTAQKAKQLSNYIKQGYYPVTEVKNCIGGQHWVAIIAVNGTKVKMADPASSSTDLTHYQCFTRTGNQRVALFKKGK